MTWGRIDEGWRSHRKILGAGPEAAGFHVACICYANAHLTDGAIPTAELSRVWPGLHPRKVGRLVRECLANGLLTETGSGGELTLHVHDFLEYNDSREYVLEKRRKEREKMRRRRGMSPGDTQGDTQGESRAPVPTRPVPTRPVPTRVSSRTGAEGSVDPPLEQAGLTLTVEATAKAKTKATKKRKTPVTGATWEAYSEAYEARYGELPKRNNHVNALLGQLVKRLGAEEAPLVASFYLTHNGSWYVTKGHGVEALIKDCESLRMQWLAGRKITRGDAREAEVLDEMAAKSERVEAHLERLGPLEVR